MLRKNAYINSVAIGTTFFCANERNRPPTCRSVSENPCQVGGTTMTDDQINIAIAENVLGWRQSKGMHPASKQILTVWTDNKSHFCHHRKPARFCNDLNAMHEAIMSLPSGVRDNSFTSQLAMVCGFKAHGSDAWSELHQGRCAVINSTARQRAEALLKTIGKWEESE